VEEAAGDVERVGGLAVDVDGEHAAGGVDRGGDAREHDRLFIRHAAARRRRDLGQRRAAGAGRADPGQGRDVGAVVVDAGARDAVAGVIDGAGGAVVEHPQLAVVGHQVQHAPAVGGGAVERAAAERAAVGDLQRVGVELRDLIFAA
jgi:hypothetical protein